MRVLLALLLVGCVPSGGGKDIKDAEVEGLCDPEVRGVFNKTKEPACPTFQEEVERLGLDRGEDPCLVNSLVVREGEDGRVEAYLCGAIGFLGPDENGTDVIGYSDYPGLEVVACRDGKPHYQLDASYGCMTRLYVQCGDAEDFEQARAAAPDFWCHENEDYVPFQVEDYISSQ